MKKEWFKVVKNQAGGVPEILVYGILSPFPDDDSISYADFQAAFRQLEPFNTNCNIRINCLGGSILEGLAMYDMITASPMKCKTICEGVAASMAAILFEAGDERVMYPNSRLMIHRAQGGISGDADSIKAYADQVQSCEDSIKSILKDRAGLSDKQVNDLMQSGVDTWITADDAVNKYHLADSIQPSAKTINITPQNLTGKKPEEIYNLFYNELKNENDYMNKLKASLVVLLATMGVKMSFDDTDEKFADEVEKAFKAKDEAVTNIAKANSTVLVQQAKTDGKINDEEVEMFVNIGTTNYPGLVTMLGKLSGSTAAPATPATPGTTIINLNSGLKPGAGAQAAANDERESWTYLDWAKKDPTALAVMENAEPEKFDKLIAGVKAHAQAKGWV
jgi:ATP-dependent Clp protease protease subunit